MAWPHFPSCWVAWVPFGLWTSTARSLVMSPFFAGDIRETTCIVFYFGHVVPEDSLLHLSVASGKAFDY